MSHNTSIPNITARAVVSPYWKNGHRAPLSGPLRGTAIVEVQFLLDGKPLWRATSWMDASRLITPGVVACLRNLRHRWDSMVLSVQAFGRHRRRLNGRTVKLSSEAEIYLDYALSRRVENYEWITRSDGDSMQSELICELPDRWLHPVIDAHWEWHSIKGYFVHRKDLTRVLNWPVKFQAANWKRRRAEELAVASIFFEDAADGTALRLWSKVFDERTIRARTNIPAVNRALRSARLTSLHARQRMAKSL